jgi:hypothetical protein
MNLLGLVGACVAMEPGSLPGMNFFGDLGYEWIYWIPPSVAVLCLVRVLLRFVVGVWARVPFCRKPPRVAAWLVTPALYILAIALSLTTAPMYLRAWLSRPFMDRFARQCLALPPASPLPQPAWIGLYPVSNVERAYGGIRFWLPTGGICCNVEVAYSPGQRLTKSSGDHEFTRPAGDWYFTGWDWR